MWCGWDMQGEAMQGFQVVARSLSRWDPNTGESARMIELESDSNHIELETNKTRTGVLNRLRYILDFRDKNL